jgi:beta-glucosidase/6-phospho-beta-glucosidase/beta-galactosidase
MRELGVPAARYGIPWHRIQPEPGCWEWRHADEPLERMLKLGIAPQVDLVHYGLPGWIEGAFLNPDYPELVADYAGRVAERFKGSIHWYTPLNEPRITAWYCGRLGWWPPYLRSWRGFAAVLLAVVEGIQATARRLHEIDPEILVYHVDATDHFETDDPAFEFDVRRAHDIVLLALDLVAGRVVESHPLHPWLLELGADPARLEQLAVTGAPPEVIGLNLYPMFSRKRLLRDSAGRRRVRMPYSDAGLIEPIVERYHAHFGKPMMISEAAASGSIERRLRWLDRSVASLRALRESGVPVTGYTWWPMFALVTWAWRQGHRSITDHLLQMGLWDLDRDLERIRTPIVDAYQALVAAGSAKVGRLAPLPETTAEVVDVPQFLPGGF